MRIVAVTDTGPLIHLAEIGVIELLNLADELFIPDTVYDELEEGGRPPGFADINYSLVETKGNLRDTEGLDPGEVAALEVALDRNVMLFTDDLAARERGTAHGIEVHGSIGIIVLGYSRGRLDRSEAATLMRKLQYESRLFVTGAVVERGIQLLEDS